MPLPTCVLTAPGMAHDAARRHTDRFSDSVMAEHAVAEQPVARV